MVAYTFQEVIWLTADFLNIRGTRLSFDTHSHFAFEEALMEEAGYEFLDEHKKTHQAFATQINGFHKRFHQGDDVSEELTELLQTWLLRHIQDDDQSYGSVVRKQYAVIEKNESGNWLKNRIKKFFS